MFIHTFLQDSQKYLKQVEDSMRQSFRKKCLANGIKPPRLDSCLISAKTGFNIEGLIDKVTFVILANNRKVNWLEIFLKSI